VKTPAPLSRDKGAGAGELCVALLGPNGETFGSPAATKRGEALKVPPARVTLRTTSCGSHVGLSAARKGAGLPNPVPHHGPCGDHYSDSGHNAERNGEDRNPEGIAVLPRLQ
jgi:hypothetical protein